ncbi:glycosyltransferase [Thermophilibacter sp.]
MQVIDLCKRLYRRVFNGRLRWVRYQPVPANPFPVDAWTDPTYPAWFERHRATDDELARQREAVAGFAYRPTFSLVVPLYKTPLDYLGVMADSVLSQTYGNLELVLVNASPELHELAAAVDALRNRDGRVRVVALEGNRGITENTNAGLEAATGEFCCFLDHDDFLEPNALFEYARALNDDETIDILFCDEDLVSFDSSEGSFCHMNPFFKPDYSPELMLCKNSVIHLMTIRRSLIEGMTKPDARFDGAQDYNMMLSCVSAARRIHHVPKVLYHWRISEESTAANPDAKPYARRSNHLALQRELTRGGIDARVVASGVLNLNNVWFVPHDESVSVVVSCDGDADKATRFLEFFSQVNSYPRVELAFVGDERSFAGLGGAVLSSGSRPTVKLVPSAGKLYERLNAGATAARGDYLVFVDTGCSFVSPEPLEQLVGLCELEGVGVVSPKTLYRNGRNKCYGIGVTCAGIMPLYRGYEDDFPGYQCNLRAFQNTSACSRQGLCVHRDLFERLGGFDEGYEDEIGAADFCKRVRGAGLRVTQTPLVKVEVEEPCPEKFFVCGDNAPDFTEADLARYDERWPGTRDAGDPYLNPNLDQASSYCQIPHE